MIPLLLLAGAAQATTFINRPIGEVVKESQNIVRGRAGESYSDWAKDERKVIYTYTPLNVTEVLKGDIKDPKIILRQPGGSKDGTEMNVPGTAYFATDEEVVVLLGTRNSDDGSYDIPGFTTGKFNVTAGENGEPVLVNSLGGGAMYDPSKDARALSYNAKIPLEVFKRIAQGEDVPEATHRQFERSQKAAPKGAFEAGHAQHFTEKPEPNSTPAPKTSPTAAAAKEPEHPARGAGDFWVPLSFAVLALAGGIGLLWMLKSSKSGSDS
jgi:hypothetical protein